MSFTHGKHFVFIFMTSCCFCSVPRTHRVLRNIKTTRKLWMYSTKYRISSLE
ncbi:hypothetical protein V6Z11_D07G196100 [Gossypium hirsutum]